MSRLTVVSVRPRARRALVAALFAVLAAPAAASAHAQLESTSPQQGATVRTAPREVSFTFGESVQATQGAVRVFDRTGRRVDDGRTVHPGGRGETVAVGLKPGVPRGTYTATYRVVSADTHVVTGGNVFSIGAASASGGASVSDLLDGQRTGAATSVAFTLARAVQYAAIGSGAGLLAFLLGVWLPALAAVAGGDRSWLEASRAFIARLRTVLLVVAAAGVASAIVGILLQGAESAGVSVFSAIDASILRGVMQTRFGVVWAAAGIAWLVVLLATPRVLAAERASAPALRRVALGADGAVLPGAPVGVWLLGVPLVALIALPALAGHASVEHPVWLFLPANLVHVTAMCAWLGGLVALLLVLPAATRSLAGGERTRLLSGALRRFSPVALTAVVALVTTGTIQALLEINAFSELLHTAYGRAVLLKIALLVVLIGLGAVNRQRTLPRLRALEGSGATPGALGLVLRRTLRAEVALVAVVLVATGALSGYAPAETIGTGPAELSATIGPAQLSVDIDPARVGANTLHVYLFDRRSGAQFAAAKELIATATLPAKGIGPLPLSADATGPGHYTIPAAVLGAPGTWTLDFTVRVSDFDEYEQQLRVRIR